MGMIKSLSAGHPVAEVFLIGWAFAYLVEGASGFGTPVALAAPMLASLGHDPISTVACLLIMNTLATQFGAVGTPVWFGLSELGLGDANLQLVGFKAAVLVGAAAYIVAPMAAAFLVRKPGVAHCTHVAGLRQAAAPPNLTQIKAHQSLPPTAVSHPLTNELNASSPLNPSNQI